MVLTGRGVLVGLAVLATALPPIVRAAPSSPTETEVEAAFLCAFAEFVDWPAIPNGVVTIGILGQDPFGSLLEETIKSRALKTKTLGVRRLSRIEDALTCQIVYVSASERHNIATVVAALGGASILTVSDIPRFAEQGGMIGFIQEARHVHFQINAAAAERAGLKISSRLLSLASIVSGPRGVS